jgi:UDP-N-acetylglucosamine 2-epimerase
LERALGLVLRPPVFAVTHHPATADPDETRRSFHGLLEALDQFPEATLVITAPNVDKGGQEIGSRLRSYADTRANAIFVPSLGQQRYLSLLKHADLVVGNSSSGLNEAPVLGARTVNVGNRQNGRFKGPTVVDCGSSSADIAAAINRALAIHSQGPKHVTKSPRSTTSLTAMVKLIKEVDLDALVRKRFIDQARLC